MAFSILLDTLYGQNRFRIILSIYYSILEREKKNPTLQENEFQSSGQLYISSFLGTHHQTVTK